MTLRVIDIETTGTEPPEARICEIASVDVTPKGVVTYRSHLVDPGVPIPPETSAIHHLIDADVAGKPGIEAVIGEHQGATAYVAHKAEFEQKFLHELLGKPTWVCTYKCALRLWPDLPSHSNQALRYRFGFLDPLGWSRDAIDPHRALSDCFVTGAIFLEIAKHARWSDLLRWSAEPALHHRFAFGKHKGEHLGDVPEDYLRWVVGKSDLDENAKFSAAYWLAQRQG